MAKRMFDFSKSPRHFSKSGVLIPFLALVFVSGYLLQESSPSINPTTIIMQTRTQTQTRTITTTLELNSNTSYSEVSVSSYALTTLNSTSAPPVTKTSSNSSSILQSSPVIFGINQSSLLGLLNLTFANTLQFIQSSNQSVPYYILSKTGTNSSIGLIYLTTDVAPSSCWGFNGLIGTLVLVNTTGFIRAITIYSMSDSWGYEESNEYVNSQSQTWLNTYLNRSVFERLRFGQDALPATGATFSSLGIINGVRDAGRIVVNDYQHQEKQQRVAIKDGVFNSTLVILGEVFGPFGTMGLQFEMSAVALASLPAGAFIAFKLRQKKTMK